MFRLRPPLCSLVVALEPCSLLETAGPYCCCLVHKCEWRDKNCNEGDNSWCLRLSPKTRLQRSLGISGSMLFGVTCGSPDQSERPNKKRKEYHSEEEDEGMDSSGPDNNDPSAPKRPRVVWSVELHRKFVATVNHLGIDKAVPKRILNLMNVDKLTRENVASHLQGSSNN